MSVRKWYLYDFYSRVASTYEDNPGPLADDVDSYYLYDHWSGTLARKMHMTLRES
jgi:hypothetical protein